MYGTNSIAVNREKKIQCGSWGALLTKSPWQMPQAMKKPQLV